LTDFTLEGTIDPPPTLSMKMNVENKLTVPMVVHACVFFLWLKYEHAHLQITAGRNVLQTMKISRSHLPVSVLPTPGPASHPGLADQALPRKTWIPAGTPRPQIRTDIPIHLDTGTNLSHQKNYLSF
jgi:hypothetical protein